MPRGPALTAGTRTRTRAGIAKQAEKMTTVPVSKEMILLETSSPPVPSIPFIKAKPKP